MDKLTAIKIKYDDGTYSDEIPVSVLSENVEWDNTHTLVDVLGSIDVDVTGTIQDQISQLFNEKVSVAQLQTYVGGQLNIDVTNWLNTNVNPVGSAVIVDSGLTISGAAADAKVTGDELTQLKSDLNVTGDELTQLKSDLNNVVTVVIGKNLINPNTLTTGAIQANGTISTDGAWANYNTSDFIILEKNTSYTLSAYFKNSGGLNKNRKGWLFYDDQKNLIQGTYDADVSLHPTFENTNATYVRVFFQKDSDGQLEIGTVRTAYDAYTETRELNSQIGLTETMRDEVEKDADTFVKKVPAENKNLINPAEIEVNKFVNNYGNIVDLASYSTSGYIQVSAGDNVAVSLIRAGAFYDKNKVFVSGSYYNPSTSEPHVFTATENGYLRVSVGTEYISRWQAEYGTESTSYEPYDGNLYFEDEIHLSETMKSDVLQVVTKSEKDLMISINSDSMIITSEIESGSLQRRYFINRPIANKLFNFYRTYLNGIEIKYCEDDITPLRVGIEGSMWTIGANHGWPIYRVNKGVLTTADCGSVWTDGTLEYTLVTVTENKADFAYPSEMIGNTVKITLTNPAATLTHVSGASHTANIDISSGVRDQMYPSVNKHEVSVYADNILIKEDGEYEANKVTIDEHYEIINYATTVEYMRNHVGQTLESIADSMETLVALDLTYEITKTTEVIYTCVTGNIETVLTNCGFIQADALKANGGTVYRYVNGVKNTSIFDSTTLVDMTNYSTNTNITSADMARNNKPSNHYVDICKDANDNILYGFTMGFVPDMSDGADTKRSSLNIIWDMRGTKKSYPVCVINKTLKSGEHVNVVGYRQYFDNIDLTNKAEIQIGNNTYNIIDAHEPISDWIRADIGDKIDVLDTVNMDVSDISGAKGVSIYSASPYNATTFKH